MKKFDFNSIKRSQIYVGDIMIIKSVNRDVLEEIMYSDVIIGDFSIACEKEIAKKDAILIEVGYHLFVDIDSINNIGDCERINELLKSGSVDNNMILSYGTYSPYKGQLYVTKLKRLKNIENSKNDVMTLKLKLKDTQN